MRLIAWFLVCFSCIAIAEDNGKGVVDVRVSYRGVALEQFVEENTYTDEAGASHHRLMIRPEPISFEATLVTQPKYGEFSLAYDAFDLWQPTEEPPVIDHSAFVGFRKNGPVIGAYVTQGGAKMLRELELDQPAVFYAIHIYNYAKGPRLVVVAAEPL